MPLDDEGAIQRKSKESGGAARLEAVELARDLVAELAKTHAGQRGNREHRRPLEARAVGEQLDFLAHFTQLLRAGEVGLGDDEDAAGHAEEMEDVEMLLALRHHAVVGGDGEEHQVHPMRAGQHVADESLMAGHVHQTRARAAGQGEIGEAEVDGDPALFFLFEAVGFLPGQSFDERGLAVINVAGGADNRMRDRRSHAARLLHRRPETRNRYLSWSVYIFRSK